MTYIIHEFSTGLMIAETPDNWYSQGFTGKWMNSTIEPNAIPHSITEAIRNNQLKARSPATSEPAVIGRVIQGNDDEYYSVIAVITQALDESRSFPVYRYFWCEGKDNLLWVIVGWFYEQKKIPVFDPLQTPTAISIDDIKAREYTEYANHITNFINQNIELRKWISKQLPPPIIGSESFPQGEERSLLIIDRIATGITSDNNLVAWAYNIVTLENPEQFLLIRSGDKESYQNFLKSKPVVQHSFIDKEIENSLISSLQDVISVKNVKNVHDNLININQVLENIKHQNLTPIEIEEYFYNVFDVLINSIDNSYQLELRTLRSILLPNTLVEYLVYVQLYEPQKPVINLPPGNNSSIKEKSLDFQHILIQAIELAGDNLENLKTKLQEGLIIATQKFFQEKLSEETLNWLITANNSLWSLAALAFEENLLEDLKTIVADEARLYSWKKQAQKGIKITEFNLDIWNNLIANYPIREDSNLNYESLHIYNALGDVFLKRENHKLAFYFYTISGNKIPPQVLENLQNIDDVFGISISKTPASNLQFAQIHLGKYANFIKNKSFKIIEDIKGSPNSPNPQPQNVKVIYYLLGTLLGVILLVATTSYIFSLFITPEPNPPTPAPNPTTPIPAPPPSKTPESVVISIPPKELDKALEVYFQAEKTHDAIFRIWKNIQTDRILNDKNPQEKYKLFVSALDNVLGLKPPNSYQQIFIDKAKGEIHRQHLEPVIDAIYNYQKKKPDKIYISTPRDFPPDGIIKLVNVWKYPNSTMTVLQEDIKKQLMKSKTSVIDAKNVNVISATGYEY